jgi:hypothetical protein
MALRFGDGICDRVDVVRGKSFQHCAAALTIAMLAGCAHPVPTLHGREVVISGWNTAQDTTDAATRKVFSEASAITLDHGYRYFEVLSPVRPGVKVTIRLYEAGESPPASPNVHDATLVMVNQPPPHEPSPEEDMIEH